jgi:spermidine synthase
MTSSSPEPLCRQRALSILVCCLFFVSGLTGLVYEVAFSKYLSYAFGVTAYASSAVLVAFMGGLSVGGLAVARWDARLPNRLLAYGLAEVVVGLFCLVSPWLFGAVGSVYVALAHALPASLPLLTALRWLLATAVVFLPAVAMGATLPLLAPWIGAGTSSRWLSALYALNVLGGAVGALGAAYGILPALGLAGTLRAAALANLGIGVLAAAIGRASGPASVPARTDPARVAESRPRGESGRAPLWLLAVWSGFLVFAAEVVVVHLLALVIGTSVYAFGLMLAIFLVCLAVGAWLASSSRLGVPSAAPLAAAAAGLATAATVPVWDHLPRLFDAFVPYATTWAAREAVRGLVACFGIVVSATAMGIVFPLLLRQIAVRPRAGAEVGRVTALNTLGSIAGSLAGGFVLLPALGSQRSLFAIAVGYTALALAAVMLSRGETGRSRGWAVAISLATLLVVAGAPPWDLARLTNGANVYFDSSPPPDAIEMIREDVHGGVTTVTRRGNLLTLFTNGKFQGNNGYELEAQRAFAHVPCALAERHDLAFVIGLGTGTTIGTLAAYPFRRIDLAELSPAIVEAAKTYFSDINGGALADPRVHVLGEDGRNALLVANDAYDLVGIEISSIWFAGAANLYNREFYQIVQRRLAPGGVLQQWVQFHHMRRRELASILGTVRAVFPHVVLYAHGNQGIIVAGARPLVMSRARTHLLRERPAVARLLGPDRMLTDFADDLLATDEALDRFVADSAREVGLASADLISTDDNLYLEYATPKNNMPGLPSIDETIDLLARYRPPDAVANHVGP